VDGSARLGGKLRRLGRIVVWTAGGLAGLALAVLLVAWSGVFNVAASRGHWAIVEWFLAFGMRNSVELRAMAVQSPLLDDPNLVTLGAAHFHGGCAFCHGTPGSPVSPIAQHMLPSPPDLKTSMRPWKDEELFWIVKHGLKYTGMPGWAALEREDEVWAAVAFLKQLRSMDAARYRDLALGGVHLPSQTGEQLATIDSNEQGAGACARCHGAEDTGPGSTLVPVLHGQPAEFLAAALQQYADGSRRSGIMQPIAAALDARDLQRLAEYYAKLAPPKREPGTVSNARAERGRQLATAGDAANGIPACDACHSGTAITTYPRLAGQSAAYMAGQLALWRAGHHTTTGGGAIMAPIARRLSASDADAVTAYFASLPAQTGRAGSP
jgi:cytochrome c553